MASNFLLSFPVNFETCKISGNARVGFSLPPALCSLGWEVHEEEGAGKRDMGRPFSLCNLCGSFVQNCERTQHFLALPTSSIFTPGVSVRTTAQQKQCRHTWMEKPCVICLEPLEEKICPTRLWCSPHVGTRGSISAASRHEALHVLVHTGHVSLAVTGSTHREKFLPKMSSVRI